MINPVARESRNGPAMHRQASPQIMPGLRVKSIRLVLDGDSTGPVVVDNISHQRQSGEQAVNLNPA